jgi:FkbM family methyltransferase
MNLKSLVPTPIREVLRPIRDRFRPDRDRFLNKVRGVIHVGANEGQERAGYARRGLHVLWVEPILEVFYRLTDNIRPYPLQIARNSLITDCDGAQYTFNISGNVGLSSSIFDLERHREMFPDVDFVDTIQLTSTTLDTLLDAPDLNRAAYDALVLDVQGAELLVLRGAQRTLMRTHYVKAEAADFASYKGGTSVDEIVTFMKERGFRMIKSHKFNEKAGVGSYFDLLFRS